MSIFRTKIPVILGSLVIIAIYIFSEYDNLSWSLAWGMGLCTMPFVLRLPGEGRSYRYLWPALILMSALLFIRSSTIFYFAASLLLLFLWEFSTGRKSLLPLFLLATISPFIGNMAYVWSFPIRLQLGEWATAALSVVGFKAEAAGNIIILNGQEFAVDPACMGLQMLITALVLAIFMMARTAYQYQQRYNFMTISIGLIVMLLLVVGANFIRLLALIIFQILPGNPLHDLVGLLSLAVYALLPFYWGWSYWVSGGKSVEEKREAIQVKPWPSIMFAGLFIWLFGIGLQFRQTVVTAASDLDNFSVPAYVAQQQEWGVLQLSKEDALVYIKPPVRAFQGGHDPRICWRGSGYEFGRIMTFQYNDYLLYQAVLEQENDTLYTAWWYDSGVHKTIREWEWRWATLSEQEQFYLVNVTAATQEELQELIADWLTVELP